MVRSLWIYGFMQLGADRSSTCNVIWTFQEVSFVFIRICQAFEKRKLVVDQYWLYFMNKCCISFKLLLTGYTNKLSQISNMGTINIITTARRKWPTILHLVVTSLTCVHIFRSARFIRPCELVVKVFERLENFLWLAVMWFQIYGWHKYSVSGSCKSTKHTKKNTVNIKAVSVTTIRAFQQRVASAKCGKLLGDEGLGDTCLPRTRVFLTRGVIKMNLGFKSTINAS